MKRASAVIEWKSPDFQVGEAEKAVTQAVLSLLGSYAAAYAMDREESLQFQEDTMRRANDLYQDARERMKGLRQLRVDCAINSFGQLMDTGRVDGIDGASTTHKLAEVAFRLRRAWGDLPENFKQVVKARCTVDESDPKEVQVYFAQGSAAFE